MRTRRGGYHSPGDGITFHIRPFNRKRTKHVLDNDEEGADGSPSKKMRLTSRDFVLEDLPVSRKSQRSLRSVEWKAAACNLNIDTLLFPNVAAELGPAKIGHLPYVRLLHTCILFESASKGAIVQRLSRILWDMIVSATTPPLLTL